MTSTKRKIIGAVAFAAALAGGATAGALLGTPAVSGAQEDPAARAPVAEDTGPGAGRPGGPGVPVRHLRPSLEVAAEQLGMSADELRTALDGGATVAGLAAERGVDLDALVAAVVDEVVASAAEAGADVDEARITEVVTRWVNGELPGPRGHGGPGGPGGPDGPGRGPGAHRHLDAASSALGITEDELLAALADGATIAGVAEERGVDVQDVIDAMVADATENLEERITAFVNGERPGPPPGAPGGEDGDAEGD